MLAQSELAKLTSHTREELVPYLDALVEEGVVLAFPLRKDTYYWHKDSEFLLRQDLSRDLKRFHAKFPYRHGMKTAEVHISYMKKAKANVFDAYLSRMVEQGIFGMEEGYLFLAGFAPAHDETYEKVRELLESQMEKAGFELLRFSELNLEKYPEDTVLDLLQLLIEEKEVVKAGLEIEMVTLASLMMEAREKVEAYFAENDLITIAQIRDMFATNRKSAKSILEYLDTIKVTKKLGAETERVAYR